MNRLTTFEAAEGENAFTLARMWADQPWPIMREQRDQGDELEELAVMAAVTKWLTAWLPAQIHHALLTGASVDQVAAAAGMTPADVAARWRTWSAGQRTYTAGVLTRDITTPHDQVAAVLAAAGL
jgi:hypothetical protein